VHSRLEAQAFEVSALHVRDLPAQALVTAEFEEPRIAHAVSRVARASALVIATPVYKASYSGLLKIFLDLLPKNGLEDKIVLPLATGGSPAHTLVLDYALRPVLSALGARHVLPGIYAVESQVRFSEDGGLDLAPELHARLEEGIERLAGALPSPTVVLPAAPPTLRLLKTANAQHC
jgi:FMN reductase